MNAIELLNKLRILLYLAAGFLLGKFAAGYGERFASEYFIGGFMLGIAVVYLVYSAIDYFFSKSD